MSYPNNINNNNITNHILNLDKKNDLVKLTKDFLHFLEQNNFPNKYKKYITDFLATITINPKYIDQKYIFKKEQKFLEIINYNSGDKITNINTTLFIDKIKFLLNKTFIMINDDNLNKITGLAQNTGLDNNSDKGQYLQYKKGINFLQELDTEMTKRLSQIETVLNYAFDEQNSQITIEQGIEKYEEERLKNAINIFWKKKNRFKPFVLYEDYDISNPQSNFPELSRAENLDISNLVFKPEYKLIRFYLGKTEIFIKNKAFDKLMKNY